MNSKIQEEIKNLLQVSLEVKKTMLSDREFFMRAEKAIELIAEAFKNNKKILIFGNGGSAADAQHFAAEMINKFRMDRASLPVISLVTDTSVLSSIGNDAGYDYVFSRQIEALGNKGDIAIAITTSDIEIKKGGHSANIANGLMAAKKKGLITVGLVSDKSKRILRLLDLAIKAPSKDTPRIQEAHITILHIICGLVEKYYFRK